jgi:hypothetical protein
MSFMGVTDGKTEEAMGVAEAKRCFSALIARVGRGESVAHLAEREARPEDGPTG